MFFFSRHFYMFVSFYLFLSLLSKVFIDLNPINPKNQTKLIKLVSFSRHIWASNLKQINKSWSLLIWSQPIFFIGLTWFSFGEKSWEIKLNRINSFCFTQKRNQTKRCTPLFLRISHFLFILLLFLSPFSLHHSHTPCGLCKRINILSCYDI